MCLYHFNYSSACQHGELTRITYCNKAIALGLPKNDGHSPNNAGVDNCPGPQLGPSSSHLPASSAKNSSSSHTNIQQQHHNSMSAFTPSQAGQPLAMHVPSTTPDEHLPRHVAFIPQSALQECVHSDPAGSIVNTTALLDAQGYRNLNIDFPLSCQSSLSMELTHDGKVTELVARFESYTGYRRSDASEVPHDDHTRASSLSTRRPSDLNTGTVRGPSEDHAQFATERYTITHTGQEQHSPRKPIPSHWLPKSSGPNLATAQRAKERSHKKGSNSGSPIDVKTLRGTRRSFDLGKTRGTEGATFLTKEALAAVENNITAPTSPRTHSRLHHSPSKPSWQSPTVSPLRSSPRQQTMLTIKLSPSRTTLLSAEAAPAEHSRRPSSITTSVGGNSFHTAEGSPVRSPAGTELSFKSAAEILDDVDVPHLDLSANSENEQALQGQTDVNSSMLKVMTEGKASSMKPRLAIRIPPLEASPNAHYKPPPALSSAESGSSTSISPWSLTSPTQASRIPRAAAASKTESARSATRSSTLKRVQPVKSLTTKSKAQQEQSPNPPQVPLLETPAAASLRHMRTVNSSGTTPILSRVSTVNNITASYHMTGTTQTELSPVQDIPDKVDKVALGPEKATLVPQSENVPSGRRDVSGQTSRATSTSTVKASPILRDLALVDSAIIYSRKKLDALGTVLHRPIDIPPTFVMMAHTYDIGTTCLNDTHGYTASIVSSQTIPATENVSLDRTRTEQYVSNGQKQAESEHSIQSRLGSDLRATAPEFVPQATQATTCDGAFMKATAQKRPDPSLEVPDLSGLDMYGIPWFYYMYPYQFAYEQGFRNGRSKYSKKIRTKNKHAPVTSPTDTQNSLPGCSGPAAGINTATASLPASSQRQASAELAPPPLVPAHRRQVEAKPEKTQSGMPTQKSQGTSPTDESSTPFSGQIDIITQQAAFRNRTNANTPRFPDTDLTTIRNANLPYGPRPMHTPIYYTVPYRGRRQHPRYGGNGLYGGRGNAGVPMHATAPFPDPVAPQGRPVESQVNLQGGSIEQYVGYSTISTEACGLVHIGTATERGGGESCNACAPNH